jgi:hypothetical protein
MNAFVLLPLQESIGQRGAGKHDQWRGYTTLLVVNYGMKKCITILTAVVRTMVQCEVDKPRDCFRKEVNWTLAICKQLWTLSEFDLDLVHHLPHTVLQGTDSYCLPEGNQ